MKTLTLAGLRVHLTGGTDRDGGGDGPLVVLLHGFGAPGTDLVPLARGLAVDGSIRFAFPEAPLSLAGMGMADARAWWMIDAMALEMAVRTGELEPLVRSTPEGMQAACEQVGAMLQELDTQLSPSQLVLGGFSQGAMLSLDLALRDSRPLAGLVLLSTTLLSADDWLPRMKARAGLPVLQSHGKNDPLLPFALAERVRDHLTEAGLDVQFVAFNGMHEVSRGVLTALEEFLQKHLTV